MRTINTLELVMKNIIVHLYYCNILFICNISSYINHHLNNGPWTIAVFLNLLSWNKWVNSIFSTSSLFFSTQLPLKIPVFQLNNLLLFHRTWAIDIQSILEFLQLIHDFLDNGNIFRSRIYIFSVVSVWEAPPWLNGFNTLLQFRWWE